jgi:hypothetical protein
MGETEKRLVGKVIKSVEPPAMKLEKTDQERTALRAVLRTSGE